MSTEFRAEIQFSDGQRGQVNTSRRCTEEETGKVFKHCNNLTVTICFFYYRITNLGFQLYIWTFRHHFCPVGGSADVSFTTSTTIFIVQSINCQENVQDASKLLAEGENDQQIHREGGESFKEI